MLDTGSPLPFDQLIIIGAVGAAQHAFCSVKCSKLDACRQHVDMKFPLIWQLQCHAHLSMLEGNTAFMSKANNVLSTGMSVPKEATTNYVQVAQMKDT